MSHRGKIKEKEKNHYQEKKVLKVPVEQLLMKNQVTKMAGDGR